MSQTKEQVQLHRLILICTLQFGPVLTARTLPITTTAHWITPAQIVRAFVLPVTGFQQAQYFDLA